MADVNTDLTTKPFGWGLLLPHLGYSRCYRCRRPWWVARESHTVWYVNGTGQFALCKRCWDRSTVEERVEAHRLATAGWEDGGEVWPLIEAAVRRDTL